MHIGALAYCIDEWIDESVDSKPNEAVIMAIWESACRAYPHPIKGKAYAEWNKLCCGMAFNPDDDTCDECGGQQTPHHPHYAPNGPDNGNCSCHGEVCE